MALPLAQETLHQFVANPDRPDYRRLGDDGELAARVGEEWLAWLDDKGDDVEWREPLPEGDMLMWR